MSADNDYAPNANGKCPHCGRHACFKEPECFKIDDNGKRVTKNALDDMLLRPSFKFGVEGGGESVLVYTSLCPNRTCQKPIVSIKIQSKNQPIYRLAYPLNITRIIPPEVPYAIRSDFQEASSVSSISAKASAALSRRCLQNMLNDQGYTGNNLCDQIDKVLESLPSWLKNNVDYIRKIGNFAAHPTKSKSTGEIVDVEQGEAEWTLNVLEQLFDFFYVLPKKAETQRDKFNAKFEDTGKSQLKKQDST
jgi:hypothetical protein